MTDSTLDVGDIPRSDADSVDSKALSTPPTRGRPDVRHRRKVGWRSRDVVRAAGLVLAMYLALRLFWFANALFLVTFLGILFGIAVSAGVDRLERFRIPRGVGAALIVLSFFGLLVGFGAWLAPTLRSQGAELRQKLPQAIDRVEEWVNKRQSGFLGILLGGSDVVARPAGTTSGDTSAARGASGARAAAPAPGPAGAGSAPAGGREPRRTARGRRSCTERIQEKLSGASRYLFPFLTHTVEAIGGFLIIVFLSIYLAADPQLYRRGVLALIPNRRRAQAGHVMSRVADGAAQVARHAAHRDARHRHRDDGRAADPEGGGGVRARRARRAVRVHPDRGPAAQRDPRRGDGISRLPREGRGRRRGVLGDPVPREPHPHPASHEGRDGPAAGAHRDHAGAARAGVRLPRPDGRGPAARDHHGHGPGAVRGAATGRGRIRAPARRATTSIRSWTRGWREHRRPDGGRAHARAGRDCATRCRDVDLHVRETPIERWELGERVPAGEARRSHDTHARREQGARAGVAARRRRSRETCCSRSARRARRTPSPSPTSPRSWARAPR